MIRGMHYFSTELKRKLMSSQWAALIFYSMTFRKVYNFQVFFSSVFRPNILSLGCGRSPLADAYSVLAFTAK